LGNKVGNGHEKAPLGGQGFLAKVESILVPDVAISA
jgi:hypothetical protein